MDPRDVSPGEDEEDKKIAHSNVHTLPVPMQLDIARGGEGEGSGSAAVEKNTVGSHEQQKLQLSSGRSNTSSLQ